MKTAELQLPYYKQGDDLAHFYEHANSAEAALRQHAAILEEAAAKLGKVASKISSEATIDADRHFISITGDNAIIDQLIEDGTLVKLKWAEDE